MPNTTAFNFTTGDQITEARLDTLTTSITELQTVTGCTGGNNMSVPGTLAVAGTSALIGAVIITGALNTNVALNANGASTFAGGTKLPVLATQTTASHAGALVNGGIVRCDATGGIFDYTLPAASAGNIGSIWYIKNIIAATTLITIKTSGGTLDGFAAGTGIAIGAAYGFMNVVSDGTNWWILDKFIA